SLVNPHVASRPIVIWNSHTGTVIKVLQGHTDDVYTLAWSPDGTYLASLAQSQDNTVRLWNPATGKQLYVVHSRGYGAMERLAWSPNSRYLAVQRQVQVGDNTTGPIVTRDEIQVWKAPTHTVLATFSDLVAGTDFTGFSWASDSARIVAVMSNIQPGDDVFIWNAFTGQRLYTYHSAHPEVHNLVAWSPDGKYIAQTAERIDGQHPASITEVWLAPAV